MAARWAVRSCFPWIVVLPVAVGLVAGCATNPSEEPTGEDVAPIIQSHVRVVDAEPGVDLDLDDTHLIASRTRFPDLATAAVGDVVISGRREGFLRRLRSIRVEGDKIIAETESASLEDVFNEVHVRGAISETATTASPAPASSGIGIAPRAVRLAIPKLSLEGRRLSIGENNEIEIVNGSFDFQPELDFDLTMHGGKVTHVKVLASGESNAQLHVRYHLSKPSNLQSGLFVRLGGPSSSGTPLIETPPYYAVFWAGYVPIVVSVRARLLADWELLVGGDVTGEQDVGANGGVSTGLEYVNGGWRDLSAKHLTLSRSVGTTNVTSHSVSGDITLTARLDVSFYELAGPYVGLQAYAGVKHVGTDSGANSGWFVQSGLRGLAGAQVAVFGRSLVGYEAVLFDVHDEQPMMR